jgi:hypothetical protein
MKSLNNTIRKLINENKSVNSLKNIHKDYECVILSCGPSLIKYKDEIQKLENKIIICVKQSIDLAPYCNYHLLNFVNDKIYNYEKPKPITFYVDKELKDKCDFNLKLNLSNHLFKTKQFKDFLLEKTEARPWGPGIMYELGFYLAYHIGCKTVTTYGWDADLSTKSHFYKVGQITNGMKTELSNAKLIEKEFLDFFKKNGLKIVVKR